MPRSVRGLRIDETPDDEATIRVAARPIRGPRIDEEPGEEHSPAEDADTTERAATPISSRLYARAAQQEKLATPVTLILPERDTSDRQECQPPASIRHAIKRAPNKTLTLVSCAVGLALLLSLLILGIAGYEANSPAERQAVQSRVVLDRQIAAAQALGVPASLLQPVQRQEQQLDRTTSSLPLRLFDASAYQRVAQSYHTLSARLPGIIAEATTQAQARAVQDIQNLQTALSRVTVQGAGNIQNFSQQLSADQLALAAAKTPGDYNAVSQSARESILALGALEISLSQLTDFNATIGRLKSAGIDVTAIEAQYRYDLQQLTRAAHASDFQNLSTLIDAQYQQIVVGSVRAFPYVSVTKLNELQTQILQLKTYSLDAAYYQQRFTADEAAVERAKTVVDDLNFLKQVDADIASMHDELVQGEAHYLVKQFQQEVAAWAKAHPYHDPYDGRTYALDSGYMQQGIGTGLVSDLAGATTITDFEVMVGEAQNALFNLHMLEADYNDHTPYNQVHKTDLAMLDHYRLRNRTVLMVSLAEQAMRVYQNGKLLNAFLVTSGRAELPSLPGVWAVLERKSPMTFLSGDPKGSPYWFPPTPIQYAIMYHYGGYFVHDAWWRTSFGPGTQFPHLDAGGNTAYNFDGSHGCINLAESAAAWVYHHTDWNTLIVVY